MYVGVFTTRILFVAAKDLVNVVEKELGSDAGYLGSMMFLGPIQVLATEIFGSIKKSKGDLNDIICCCTSAEISALKAAYQEGKSTES